MSKALRTRCPGCNTAFLVIEAQLDARGGLVRCGRCAAVFRAERNIVETPAAKSRKRQRKARKHATAAKRSDSKPAAKRHKRTPPETGAAPQAAATSVESPAPEVTPAEFVTPALARILLASRSSHIRRGLWVLATLVLLALLAAQAVYFYASELARSPRLKPWIVASCARVGCVIRPQQDIQQIQLLHTSIAPHPQQRDALRIRSSLVNRADFAQPYPLMEVTLTSRNGEIIARRTYLPHEYLTPTYWSANMTPDVVIKGVLDINHPAPTPTGYEIRLVATP